MQSACLLGVQFDVSACIGILLDTSMTLHASVTQVDEMEKAVDVAEKNMNRFGLTTQEIRSRRSWVHDTRRTVRQDKHLEILDKRFWRLAILCHA